MVNAQRDGSRASAGNGQHPPHSLNPLGWHGGTESSGPRLPGKRQQGPAWRRIRQIALFDQSCQGSMGPLVLT